jgi:hypothetical protein
MGEIGAPGTMGFGVGACPVDLLPTGMTAMPGHDILGHDNYGNYQFSEGSVMVYVPWHVYRIAHASNPTYAVHGVNSVDIKGVETYPWKTSRVSAITKANPAVVTTDTPHGRTAGDYIWLSHITSDANWAGDSGKLYKVGTVGSTTTFNLQTAAGVDVDASGYAAAFSNATDLDAMIVYTGAEADGYATPRAMIDGGMLQKGYFVDKYKCSKVVNGTGYTAASIKYGYPLSANAGHNPFSGCTGGANYLYSAIDLAHRRDGSNGDVNASSIFFAASQFIHADLAMLSLAHGQAATSTVNCAWYHATYNYPKGCNNDALKDTDDTTVVFESDGYLNCGKTGSGVSFAKTTHNGQNCGVADLNGLVWEVSPGMTCIATTPAIEAMTQASPCQITVTGHGLVNGDYVLITGITQADWSGANDYLYPITKVNDDAFTIVFDASGFGTAYDSGDTGVINKGVFYVAKESTAMKTFTHDNTTATGHWGATGVAAMMQVIDPPIDGATILKFGNGANQVLSESLSGSGWLLTGLGFAKDANGYSSGGTNLFGQDYYYRYIRNEMCLISCGSWYSTADAGVWYVGWYRYRSYTYHNIGFRVAAYPE